MFWDRHARLLRLLATVTLVLWVAGCGSDGSPANADPTLQLTAPLADVDVAVGDPFQLSYVDDDPDDAAKTDLYADRDGDLATQQDQFAIATDRPENGGAPQSVTWNTTGIPEGSYFLVGVIDDGVNPPVVDRCPGKLNVWNTWPRDHTNIVLKDRLGNAIQLNSTEPYSPRQTCGTCHDVDEIANGYHFQQGRTDDNGIVPMKDDFNGDGRTWLKSDGMYGKW
jgi:hypothetical protein